jgi:hypothetical protein
MKKLGFKELVPEQHASHIITTYLLPDDPNFSFEGFYTKLAERGLLMPSHDDFSLSIFCVEESIWCKILALLMNGFTQLV